MHKKLNWSNAFFPVLCSIILFISSCSTSKKVKYFQNISDSIGVTTTMPHHAYTEPKINKKDVLYVSMQTLDQKNMSTVVAASSGNANENTTGYTVDNNGYIEVPLIGSVKVEGLTTTEAKETIRAIANKYYKDPVINVTFLSMYVDVIGEVARPGRLPLPNEKVTIIDALAMAGDLTITAKRENVLLIREENGQKTFIRFDLNRTDLFQSPYYYMRSGDAIYVEPNKAKSRASTTDTSRDRYLTYLISIVSVTVLVLNLFERQNDNNN